MGKFQKVPTNHKPYDLKANFEAIGSHFGCLLVIFLVIIYEVGSHWIASPKLMVFSPNPMPISSHGTIGMGYPMEYPISLGSLKMNITKIVVAKFIINPPLMNQIIKWLILVPQFVIKG